MKRQYESIIEEAKEYNVSVLGQKVKSDSIRFVNDNCDVLAWMYNMIFDGKRQWRGYTNNTNNRFTGSKTKVADWCLNQIVNGYDKQN